MRSAVVVEDARFAELAGGRALAARVARVAEHAALGGARAGCLAIDRWTTYPIDAYEVIAALGVRARLAIAAQRYAHPVLTPRARLAGCWHCENCPSPQPVNSNQLSGRADTKPAAVPLRPDNPDCFPKRP